MIFFDIVIQNVFYFLTFLNSSFYKSSYDGKLHSFIVTGGLLTLNFFSISRFIYYSFLGKTMPKEMFYVTTILIFVAYYIFYFKRKRINEILKEKKLNLINVLITASYVFLTFYVFIKTGDYLRGKILV